MFQISTDRVLAPEGTKWSERSRLAVVQDHGYVGQ